MNGKVLFQLILVSINLAMIVHGNYFAALAAMLCAVFAAQSWGKK